MGASTTTVSNPCCSVVHLDSTGDANVYYPSLMYDYLFFQLEANGKPTYKLDSFILDAYLYYNDTLGGWAVIYDGNDLLQVVSSATCPEGITETWEFRNPTNNNNWETDSTLDVTCPGTTTPVPTTPLTTSCCSEVLLDSSGLGETYWHDLLGEYALYRIEPDGRATYEHKTALVDFFLHYAVDSQTSEPGWTVNMDAIVEDSFGYFAANSTATCPDQVGNGWYVLDPNDGVSYIADPTTTVTCIGTTTVPSTGGTGATGASTQTTTTSGGPRPPPSGIWTRTVILINALALPTVDLFINGGIDEFNRPGCGSDPYLSTCSIDIRHLSIGPNQDEYDVWKQGDTVLDWFKGPQNGQGDYAGIEALGTPSGWTTNEVGNSLYYDQNTYGPDYWAIEFEMDCDQTIDGWFELHAVLNDGTEELLINQGTCTGSGASPGPSFVSSYHIARCGYRNVFEFNDLSLSCIVDDIV